MATGAVGVGKFDVQQKGRGGWLVGTCLIKRKRVQGDPGKEKDSRPSTLNFDRKSLAGSNDEDSYAGEKKVGSNGRKKLTCGDYKLAFKGAIV